MNNVGNMQGNEVPVWLDYSVLLLCGLPSSGKSSIASLLIQQVNTNQIEINSNETSDCLCSSCHASTVFNTSSFFHQYYNEAHWIDYDDITESILGEKIKQERRTSREQQDETVVVGKEMDADHYFDRTHREAWRTARVVAQERLEQLLLMHHGFQSTTEERGGETKHMCSYCQSYYYKPQRRILIVLDDNFHLRSMRRDIYRQCQRIIGSYPAENYSQSTIKDDRSMGRPITIGFSTLVVHTHPSICKTRNATRKGRTRVPDEVMNHMISTMEYPTNEKDNSVLRIDTSQIDYSNRNSCEEILFKPIKTLLLLSLIHPIAPPVQPDIDPTDTKVSCSAHHPLHSIDLILRHLVSVTCTKDKSLARPANKVRKLLLDKYRHEYKDSMTSQQFEEDEMKGSTNIKDPMLVPRNLNQDVIYRQFVKDMATVTKDEKTNLPLTPDLVQEILKSSIKSNSSRNVS